MQKAQLIPINRPKEEEAQITHFELLGLLPPGQTLALSGGTRTLSLLYEGRLVTDRQFSVNEMRILEPILHSFPHYCPYEELLAHLATNTVTVHVVARCRQR